MQQPLDQGGVNLCNRRWHLHLHSNSFIGSDMTLWLLDNFEDFETRLEVEAFGNKLMAHDDGKHKEKDKSKKGGDGKEGRPRGLFVHAEKRHEFRDNNYYYQISNDYAKSQLGWFGSKRREPSVPPTPMNENSPRLALPRPQTGNDNDPGASNSTTPTITGFRNRNNKRPRVYLSKRIDLHYNRLHNPDDCYHTLIDWMNTTSKLVENVVETNPFRRPVPVKLAVRPSDKQPDDVYQDPNSSGPQTTQRKYFYQTAILGKFDFVLDMEAASNFAADVDVKFSWGKPDYRYTQYIHRSGRLITQITDENQFNSDQDRGGGDGSSRMVSSMSSYSAINLPEPTPISSPLVKPAFHHYSPALKPSEPEQLMAELEDFCSIRAGLETFQKDTMERGEIVPGTPALLVASGLEALPEASIPTLGLRPGVLGREGHGVRTSGWGA
ncbi:Vacuolar membrane-associated protein iml1 [Emericellopsis cladophorae]|uniref:Vacuolar membrane-associated protein IML1 n=1 Tax=Emericellopsis cladophorae TaxID=2686198 RepID=A0A9P9XVG1_9HYPO|nr:Vacuolar membrane-associated protein iml1 [Emericellopsis cladophorae]KAI6778338.1 Vacuolar membrane-associated protein iml1 [Emericellopsis cladophorae]